MSLHDFQRLQSLSDGKEGYLACTTDRIFQSKEELYDLLVDCETGQVHYSATVPAKHYISSADKIRWESIWDYAVNKAISPTTNRERQRYRGNRIISAMIRSITNRRGRVEGNRELNSRILQTIDETPAEELSFDLVEYFVRINSAIFENLMNLASSSSPVLRPWHLEQMGLSPQHDSEFIMDFIRSHDIPVTLDYLQMFQSSPIAPGGLACV